MEDRHFYTAACPFCREQVFASPYPGPVIVRAGTNFTIAATSMQDTPEAVDVVGRWSTNDLPAFTGFHRCHALAPDRHGVRRLSALLCPFCRSQIVEVAYRTPIVVVAGQALSAVSRASDNRVETELRRGGSELINVSHACPGLRPPLTPEQQAELRAQAIAMMAEVSPTAAMTIAELTDLDPVTGKKR